MKTNKKSKKTTSIKADFNHFYVDIPNRDSEEWINVETFPTREEAIAFAKEHFGADDNGMIPIVFNF